MPRLPIDYHCIGDGEHMYLFFTGDDGNFYGTAYSGGALEGGTVFRLVRTPHVASAITSNNAVTLTWSSFTNGTYRVEHKPSATATNWTPLAPDVTATNTVCSYTDTPPGGEERYYRVLLLPW